MLNKTILGLLLSLVITSGALGQFWTTHTNMNTVFEIVTAGDSLFCATNGGILAVNTSGNSFSKITNTDGLGGISIGSAALDTQNTLWLGSSNGQLSRFDLSAKNWKVYKNFADQNGQKLSLFSIFPDGDKIWIGHNQGLTLFDGDKNGGEIKENYQNFSGLISPLSVQACIVWGNQIWIGTSAGVALAGKNDINLLDPSHWTGINKNSGRGLSNDHVLSLALWQDTLWVGTQNGAFRLNPADTTFTGVGPGGLEIRDLKDLNGNLYAATSAGLYSYVSGIWSAFTSDSLASLNLNSIAQDKSGKLWAGTAGKGMAKFNGSFWENLSVSGPPGNIFNDLFLDQAGRLWCCNHEQGGSLLDGQNWTVFDTLGTRFMAVAVDPQNQAWFGTLGRGVLRYRNGIWKIYNHQTPANSPLSPVCPNPNFVAVFGVALDEQGNIWFGNRDACDGTSLVGLLAGTDSTFVSFKENENINGTALSSNSMPFCFAKDGTVWVGYIDTGLDALNYNFTLTNKGDDLVTNFPASNFAFGLVAGVAIDKEGLVWIGTSGGLYFYDPSTLQLTGLTLPSGLGPQVNSIAVDSRNNKWLGTINGLVKLDAEGNFLEAFTTDNSPLADNLINKVLYHEKNGELWVGTDNGLSKVSLPLTQAAENPEGIYAYPNPYVIKTGTEKLNFAKLAYEAKINIFTPGGDFVRELVKTNQWDGRNDRGELVASGVYFFLVSQPDGKNALGKIALIRQ